MNVIERKIDLISKLNKKVSRKSYNDFLEVGLLRLIVRDMLIAILIINIIMLIFLIVSLDLLNR